MFQVRTKILHCTRQKFTKHSKFKCYQLRSVSQLCNIFSKDKHDFPLPRLQQMEPLSRIHFSRSFSSAQPQISQKNGQSSEVKDFSVIDEGKKLRVVWADGKTSNYHAVWLRFNCKCGSCCDPASNMCSIILHEMPLTSTIQSVQQREGGRLSIQFVEENHTSTFDANWLKEMCYSEESLKEKRNALKPTFLIEESIPQIPYSEVEQTGKGLYRWLKSLNEYGLCLLKGVPAHIDMLRTVIQLIGPVQISVYGEMYEVYVRDAPINLAYSSKGLQFHTDLPMYEDPPGIQFLHCIKFDESVTGGETTFVDLLHVAEEFRVDHPEEFRTLTTVPCPYDRIHHARDHAVHMTHRRPAILLNNRNEIITIKWSPAYHGPIAVDEEYVEPFYRAFQLFGRAVQEYRHRKSIRLVPGDLIGFNNRRICHGRNAFEQMKGERHLQGGYVNIDDFKSKLMVLHGQYGEGSPVRRVYNTDWS